MKNRLFKKNNTANFLKIAKGSHKWWLSPRKKEAIIKCRVLRTRWNVQFDKDGRTAKRSGSVIS
jgi:hypothetical protein